ncbi:SCO2195 family GlnR-regulated protein [Streptomyces chumphonensis]|uniref:SCO2195 family GlnR-regulated protein n=1 Tax=Streptomyces chumphonensis TaxID=1214925 RepID=UPI003D71E0A2
MPPRPVRDDVTVTPARPGLSTALLALETVLLRGGHATARRNAWTSVLEDRRRAQDRREAAHVLEAAAEGTSPAT